nr:uncharacterized protein LOC123756459 [Procambarus clarkii]
MAASDLQSLRSNIYFDRYNNCIIVVAQREMCRVFLWFYHQHHQEDPRLYVGDCLRRTRGGMNGLSTRERASLGRRDNPVKMDITLLYKLLQRTCNLAEDPPTSSVWNSPTTPAEEQSLEHTLYKIKELRNELVHEPMKLAHMTEDDLKARVCELCDLCCHIIQEAGPRTGRTPQEINTAIDNIKNGLQYIQTSRPASGMTPQKFAMFAKQEYKELRGTTLDTSSSCVIPIIKRSISMTAMTPEEEVSLSQLLKWRCVDGTVPEIIVVQGDIGAGKTFLSQQVMDSWLKNDNRIDDLAGCDLVVLIQCHDVFTRDLVRLLQDNLLPQTIQCCEATEVMGILNSLRILWIIDGFEDASADAKGLLTRLFSLAGPEQTFIVTSRPEYTLALTNIIPKGKNICEVTLSGLSSGGRNALLKELIQKKISNASECTNEYEQFKIYLKQQSSEVQMELSNPLKLILAVKIWKDKSEIELGTTLSDLYSAIQDVHVKNIMEKLRLKCNLLEEELLERVQDWLKILYKVAFDMTTKSRFIIIEKDDEKLLKGEGRCLLPSYADCLSTFLSLTEGGSQYKFVHNTQQYYFAAQHICALLSHETFDESKFAELFNVDLAQTGQIDRFYEVLLHTVSSLITQGKLNNDTTKVLIKILSHCQNCSWLDVVHYASCTDTVVKEVSNYMPDLWGVNDASVKATLKLLQYKTPSTILIVIREDPDKLIDLKPLLKRISEIPVFIDVCFSYYFNYIISDKTCDDYIRILCDSSAKCVIFHFTGKLSTVGCSLISQMPHIRVLKLIVPTKIILEIILSLSSWAEDLEELVMMITMTNFNSLIGVSARGDIVLDVYLSNAVDTNLEPVVNFLRRISNRYRNIGLHGASAENALHFVQGLKAKGVKAECLQRIVNIDTSEIKGRFILPYGPIPSTVSEMQFLYMWRKPEVNLIISGNVLSVTMTVPMDI